VIVLIDNYDSFVYNLYQCIGTMEPSCAVFRNDRITCDVLSRLHPSHIVISPGPCTPHEAGISETVVRYFQGAVPILGVCLGHQTIAQAYGARIIRSRHVMHGKTARIYHDGKTIFQGLANPFIAARYHSLMVEEESLPDCFEVSAWTEDGIIMGIRHKKYVSEGVQFHPESYLTRDGIFLLRNSINIHSLPLLNAY